MKTRLLLATSLVFVVIFAAIWFLAEARLDTVPPDTRHFALQSRRETFEDVRSLAIGFVIGGGAIAGLSATLLAWRSWRRRHH